ncbi:MAG: solute carrier family 26 protein [Bacteroidota bacterium]
MGVFKYIPLLEWIKSYDKQDLRGDLSAGLTVGVMLIPQGMAYAMLAGMPPIYGLYASTIPLILYAIFGTSRQLAVGPVAMVALLVANGVGQIADTGSDRFIALAILLALMVGVIQLALGVFRLGFLVNFLSHPVISGFTSAAALIIGLSQLKHLLGLDIPRSNFVHEIIINAFQKLDQIHLPTVILGLGGIAVILLVKRFNKAIPGPLVAVVLSTLAVYLLNLHTRGLKIVQEVPEGFPGLTVPAVSGDDISLLLPTALTIALVGFMESFAVAKAIQAKHKNYEVKADQELIGLGVANIVGSLFKSFPTTGGFSRTAVNDQAGARTGMASIISAVLIILTLLFLTPLFYYLPKAILASIIMVAVFGLIDFKEAVHLWKADRRDFYMLIATFLATLTLGIEEGIAIGVVLSLGMVIYRATYPHIAVLGKVPGTKQYRNIYRFPDAQERPEILIVRFDAQLFFANIGFFRDKLQKLEDDHGTPVKLLVLNAEAINGLDSSAVGVLYDLVDDYRARGVDIYFSGVKGPIRDIMFKSGLTQKIGETNFFMHTEHAVSHFDKIKNHQSTEVSEYALQTNVPLKS